MQASSNVSLCKLARDEVVSGNRTVSLSCYLIPASECEGRRACLLPPG